MKQNVLKRFLCICFIVFLLSGCSTTQSTDATDGTNETELKETIAEQIISALAGSMGVVYTVPITSFVYSILNRDKVIYKKTSDNKVNGKRSLKI